MKIDAPTAARSLYPHISWKFPMGIAPMIVADVDRRHAEDWFLAGNPWGNPGDGSDTTYANLTDAVRAAEQVARTDGGEADYVYGVFEQDARFGITQLRVVDWTGTYLHPYTNMGENSERAVMSYNPALRAMVDDDTTLLVAAPRTSTHFPTLTP